MTQIVHSSSRETRTKRIAWVTRLRRTERYYRGFGRNVAGLARGSHSSSVNAGSAARTHGTALEAPGLGKIVRSPRLTYAPAAKRTSIAPIARDGWRWCTAAANDGHRSSPLVIALRTKRPTPAGGAKRACELPQTAATRCPSHNAAHCSSRLYAIQSSRSAQRCIGWLLAWSKHSVAQPIAAARFTRPRTSVLPRPSRDGSA